MRRASLAALGVVLLAAAAGALTAYLLLLGEDGPGIQAADVPVWAIATGGLFGLVLVVAFRAHTVPRLGPGVIGFGAGVFILATFVYLTVGNLVDQGALPRTSASRGELLLPPAGLLCMTCGCLITLISLKRE